jgi:hypothetical protein
LKIKSGHGIKIRQIFFTLIIIISLTTVFACNSPQTNTKQPVKPSLTSLALFQGLPIAVNEDYKPFKPDNDSDRQAFQKKYEGNYYVYDNNARVGKFLGKLKPAEFEGEYRIVFPDNALGSIAISKDYDAIPRPITIKDSKFSHDYSNVLSDSDKKLQAKTKVLSEMSVDLDNDGKNEYILTISSEDKKAGARVLLNSKFEIVTYLYYFTGSLYPYVDNGSEQSVQVIDIDNDKIMEIISDVPQYETFKVICSKYDKGVFTGQKDYKTNLNS